MGTNGWPCIRVRSGLEIKAERLLLVRSERIGRHKMGLIETESFGHQIKCAMVFEGKALVLVD